MKRLKFMLKFTWKSFRIFIDRTWAVQIETPPKIDNYCWVCLRHCGPGFIHRGGSYRLHEDTSDQTKTNITTSTFSLRCQRGALKQDAPS